MTWKDATIRAFTDPQAFFFSPIGQFLLEFVNYVIFLIYVSYLTSGNRSIYDSIDAHDTIFWICASEFVLEEILHFKYVRKN